jgi:beta-galactosidase
MEECNESMTEFYRPEGEHSTAKRVLDSTVSNRYFVLSKSPLSMTFSKLLVRTVFLTALLFVLNVASGGATTRIDQVLPGEWKFVKSDAGIGAATNSWIGVTIPHTWNTKAADEALPNEAGYDKNDPRFKDGYYRGACWYARSLDIPTEWKNRRVFIRFEAASLVAKTWINGQLLGEHRGGFTAFCYELTPYLHFGGHNELRVQVDNSHQEDIPPLSGDFNVDGGIYRPVHLIVTDQICISPLEMASPGLYLTTKSLSDSAATVEVKTLISNGTKTPTIVPLKIEITDADGKVVAKLLTKPSEPIASGKTQPFVATVTIPSPHRWNGRKDPYLYTVKVSLMHGDEILDYVVQPLGLRTVGISEEKGFLLNGQPYPIHGVNRHQDWGGQGWGATRENEEEDARLMLDMGVTAIRLAHYPQSDHFHGLCDHNGILLWNEVSLVNEIRDTPEFAANAEQQLRELILQRYNHPSAAFWGLFNEMKMQKNANPIQLISQLKSVVQEIDPSRLIVSAILHLHEPYNLTPDHPCFNCYPGWYGSGTLDKNIEADSKEAGKRIAISEYGAGANTLQHQESNLVHPNPKGPFHPEEWQTHVHELDWADIKDNPHLWGSFVWVMFDFQVASRHEGSQPMLNDKGLVTQDRKTKKDTYFLYQSNWNDGNEHPMVHIASSGMTPRKLLLTDLDVFSNCNKVKLTVNGKPLAPVSPDAIHVSRWTNVLLQPGNNEIKAVAASPKGEISDSCKWVVDPSLPPNPLETDTSSFYPASRK